MSFDQLHKKKQPAGATSAAPRAAAPTKNITPAKPPTAAAPQTHLHDLKKFVHSDKKAEMPSKGNSAGKDKLAAELKPASGQSTVAASPSSLAAKEKEKKPASASEKEHEKLVHKGKDIEEN